MYTAIKTKFRSIVEDVLKTNGSELFTYTTSKIFKLMKENVTAVNTFKINGILKDSSETATLDTTSGEVTIDATLVANDQIEIQYSYYNKYSEADVADYIRAALVWISIYTDKSFELVVNGSSYEIEDTPDIKYQNIIALVASILAKPDYSQYRLPDVTVVYPRTLSKEKKIEKLLNKLSYSTGIQGLITLEALQEYDA